MTKAHMITTIARQTASSWLDLKIYGRDLHMRKFKPDEISGIEFSAYCDNDMGYMMRASSWYTLMKLCESLNIDYDNIKKKDKHVIDCHYRAFQAFIDLSSRLKQEE